MSKVKRCKHPIIKEWESLLKSDEYRNASPIQQAEYRVGFGLRKTLGLDNEEQFEVLYPE